MKKSPTKHQVPRRFDPVGKSKKTQRIMVLLTALVLLFSGTGMGIMSLYFGTGKYKLDLFAFYFEDLFLVLLNVLPFVLLIFLLWFLTNRPWVSFLCTGIFTLIFSWAQYWKLMSRSDPIYAEDLTLIKEGVQMGVHYISITWQIVLSAVLVAGGTLIVFFFFRGRISKLWLRLPLTAVILAGSFFLYQNVYLSGAIYNDFTVWKKLNPWLDNSRYMTRGSMYPFLFSIPSAGSHPPEEYDADLARSYLETYRTDEIPEDRKVNVVMIMFEAFADLSVCTDRITGVDPYASYHALESESYHGTLVTNIFAGGTIDTERCALTGFNTLTSFRRPSWSYARYFADQGYAVNGSHPSYEAFYSRMVVNENMGVSPYYYLENHYKELAGGIAMDDILLPEILRLCREDAAKGGYVFSFNVTYQNHGPYPADEARFTEEYLPRGDLDEASYTIVNNYLHGVEDTSNRMLAMAEELRDDPEPYILVFFGDHKPWMGEQGSVYGNFGVDIYGETDESFYNYYSTQYLIWANEAAKEKLGEEFTGEGPTISPCYLMNELFGLCGWEGPSYLKLSNTLKACLPVITTNRRYVQDGKLIWNTDLTPENRELLKQLSFAQYYLMRDAGAELPSSN